MKCPNCNGKGYRLSTSWVPYKSTTTINCQRCQGTGKLAVELSRDCPTGTLVKFRQRNGAGSQGILTEWDNGTAIVDVDGHETAVRCD